MSGLSGKTQFVGRGRSSINIEENNNLSDRFISIKVGDPVLPESITSKTKTTDIMRSASLTSKMKATSVCTVDGEKATIKSINKLMQRVIRFWSTESIKKLDSNEFINYIDLHLGIAMGPLLQEVQSAYTEWTDAFDQLRKLLELQRRMVDGDEFSLTSHYFAEV